jgi:hypothetical protein
VEGSREILEVEPGRLTDQRDVVFLASRLPVDCGDRLHRLSERLRGSRDRPGVL